jgi:hypothetical protein
MYDGSKQLLAIRRWWATGHGITGSFGLIGLERRVNKTGDWYRDKSSRTLNF